MQNKSLRETKRLTQLGYPPFNVFDVDDNGKLFTPVVYKVGGNTFRVTFAPDTDLKQFAIDANVTLHPSDPLPLKFADTAFFNTDDRHERGNVMLLVIYTRN